MKLVGINGSLSELSYNRKLLEFIGSEYTDLFDFEILDLYDVPMFKQFVDQTDHFAIDKIYQAITNADGVIIAVPEHMGTVAPAVKNIIEHLSVDKQPFQDKPVFLVGASYHYTGTGNAQKDLKQTLEAPGVNAYAMPGNEFLLGNAREAFDESGRLKDEGTVNFLRSVLESFVDYVKMITAVKGKGGLDKSTDADSAASGEEESASTDASTQASGQVDTNTSASSKADTHSSPSGQVDSRTNASSQRHDVRTSASSRRTDARSSASRQQRPDARTLVLVAKDATMLELVQVDKLIQTHLHLDKPPTSKLIVWGFFNVEGWVGTLSKTRYNLFLKGYNLKHL